MTDPNETNGPEGQEDSIPLMWACTECGYSVEGEPPDQCPECGSDKEKFDEVPIPGF